MKKEKFPMCKIKRFYYSDIARMEPDVYETFKMAIENDCFRLIGVDYKENVKWYKDPKTNDIVFIYD